MKKSVHGIEGAARLAAAALGVLLVVSCSGAPRDPGRIARKLVRAHGGPRKVERIQTFTGKGFIRDLGDATVASSNAFDIYRSGERYKHRLLRPEGNTFGDAIVMCINAEGTWEWRKGEGLRKTSPMEFLRPRYRFPAMLSWIQEKGRFPELLGSRAKDGGYRLRYRDGDFLLTVTVNHETWLLDAVEVQSAGDTTLSFSERYGAYTDLDGIPFPQRFAGSYRGQPLYEYLLSVVELQGELPDSVFTITNADTMLVSR